MKATDSSSPYSTPVGNTSMKAARYLGRLPGGKKVYRVPVKVISNRRTLFPFFSLVILIAQLKKRVVERALAGELTHHLGYAKGEAPDEIDSHRTE